MKKKFFFKILTTIFLLLCFTKIANANNFSICLHQEAPFVITQKEKSAVSTYLNLNTQAKNKKIDLGKSTVFLVKKDNIDFFKQEEAGIAISEYKNLIKSLNLRQISFSVDSQYITFEIKPNELKSILKNNEYCLYQIISLENSPDDLEHHRIIGQQNAYNQIQDKALQIRIKIASDQLIKGNYTDEITLMGTIFEIGAGLLGIDLPMDIRDLFYDLSHWGWNKKHLQQTTIDSIGIIPIIGVLKNTDEVATLVKRSKRVISGKRGIREAISKLNLGGKKIKVSNGKEFKMPKDWIKKKTSTGVRYENPLDKSMQIRFVSEGKLGESSAQLTYKKSYFRIEKRVIENNTVIIKQLDFNFNIRPSWTYEDSHFIIESIK